MTRRIFLKHGLGLAATGLVTRALPPALAWTGTGSPRSAAAQDGVPLERLRAAVDEQSAVILRPGQEQFARYQRYASCNSLVAASPKARVLCKTPHGVAATIRWARENNVPFSIRGGGHSFETLSQSDSVVIDMRLMTDIRFEPEMRRVSVGGGALLGEIYAALAEKQQTLPAGSCPQVGIAGHALGGGYGLLARPFGLACDSLLSLEVVDAQGQTLTASADENADLFWACRGGGGGSFGVVTRLDFQTRALSKALRFALDWDGGRRGIPARQAVEVMAAWQAWAPSAPDEITSIIRLQGAPEGGLVVRCIGLSTKLDAAWLAAQLSPLLRTRPARRSTPPAEGYAALARRFAGPPHRLTGALDDREFFKPLFIKAKSDYVTGPMSERGIEALMQGLEQARMVSAICDAYGGAVARLAPDATAFAHRGAARYGILYYAEWSNNAVTAARLRDLRALHAAMRPYVSGAAYVNYADTDLTDWPAAYWGRNLERLKRIKSRYDPDNVFRHAQSVPLS